MDILSPRAAKAQPHYTYALLYPDNYPDEVKAGTVFYVGKGTHRDRIYQHENEAKRGGKSYKCNVIRKILSYGLRVVKKKLAFFETNEEACMYESALICFMDGLTNLTLGGEGVLGCFPSDETRRKIGVAHQGRKKSVESVRKTADAKRGKPLTFTAESKARAIAAHAKMWPGFVAPDGTRYENIVNLNAFCREYGLRASAMKKVAQGKHTHHQGWTSITPRIVPPQRFAEKQHTDATKSKMRQAQLGKPKSETAKQKMADAKAGVWCGFIAPDGMLYHDIVNLRAFCREHGLRFSHMWDVARGKANHHKGWKRIE